jgi:anti-sigma regulatory factor (Ser/Thr protein kinase)
MPSAASTPNAARARRSAMPALTGWITAAALQHGTALPQALMAHLGVSRRRAGELLRQLVQSGWLQREGTARRPQYHPGGLRQVVRRYALDGLQEDLPWRRDFAPFFDLPPQVARLAQHAFTELLNNAVDHSGGTRVTVSMRQTPLHLQLLVSDDGCGLFQRVHEHLGIDDPRLAMFELSKGKLTTQPSRHAGQGLFFVSQLADIFDLHANHSAYQQRRDDHTLWHAVRPMAPQGTSVYVAIALDTQRSLPALQLAHSALSVEAHAAAKADAADPARCRFDRTRVPLQLLAGGSTLASRAEARRVAARLTSFEAAELDFAGIGDLGQGFADELFRVFARQHPQLTLLPTHMAPGVAAMVDSVRRAAA